MTAPLSAEEVALEIKLAKAQARVPPGFAWEEIQLDPSGRYGRGSGRSMVEFQAACGWFRLALVADDAKDSATLGATMSEVRRIPMWWAFSDPLVASKDIHDFVANVVADAGRGDFASMAKYVRNNCD